MGVEDCYGDQAPCYPHHRQIVIMVTVVGNVVIFEDLKEDYVRLLWAVDHHWWSGWTC